MDEQTASDSAPTKIAQGHAAQSHRLHKLQLKRGNKNMMVVATIPNSNIDPDPLTLTLRENETSVTIAMNQVILLRIVQRRKKTKRISISQPMQLRPMK